MADSNLCEVYSAANVQEAHLVAAALEDAGIKARVIGAGLQNAVGELPAVAIAPRVWVDCKDVEKARAVIAGIRASASSGTNKTKWTCPKCGETNEPTFDVCWNCQTPRPDTA